MLSRCKLGRNYYTVMECSGQYMTEAGCGDSDGYCEDPSYKKPRILIRAGIPPGDRLETIIHEALHALDPSKTEWWVTQSAKQIKNLLWKMGYRHVADQPNKKRTAKRKKVARLPPGKKGHS